MPATRTIMPRAPLASTASVTTSPTDTRARAASCRDNSTPGGCALDGESAALAAAAPRKSAMSVARRARPITAGLWHGVRRRVRPYNSRSLVTDPGRNELTDRARDAARRRSAAIGGSPGERQRVAFGSPTADEARLPTCFAREIDATAESRLENRARDFAPCHPPPARFLRELTIERRRHPNRQHGRFILRTSHPVYSIQTPDAGRRLRTHRGLRAHRRRTDGGARSARRRDRLAVSAEPRFAERVCRNPRRDPRRDVRAAAVGSVSVVAPLHPEHQRPRNHLHDRSRIGARRRRDDAAGSPARGDA